ncbi:MAG TPA: peptide ABC transporter substrate-binding protein [Cycloclasticus sp.]|jgi:ABC-type transport system substrate-binding protein|nr:peptide ABC transporter substrate-binding protein [Cycloclasticus sp.]HIL91962.1 peptide ABC transporter substrate-binding protein [Cycloclasticus sp.]
MSTPIKHVVIVVFLLLSACSDSALNNPYSESEHTEKIIYTAFSERPKHLDPAKAYSSNEYAIIAQVYEPLFQYHYLKRPYQLEPLLAASMPTVSYFDYTGAQLPVDAADAHIAYSEYQLSIMPKVSFQPHPSFNVALHKELPLEWSGENVYDLPLTSRQLTSDDFIYQIKRLADPATQSPIAGLMGNYIVGFTEFSAKQTALKKQYPMLRKTQRLQSESMLGVKRIDDLNFSIRIKGKYPQFINWLAMPFFAPMPWEADEFYSNPNLQKKNISLDWFPVGTGPYYLQENNPNRRMVLAKNPNFHDEFYPTDGAADSREKGLLNDAGKKLPLTDKVMFSLEKESIPYWNKFLQGYYDSSGISSDSFDQAVSFSGAGDVGLTEDMLEREIDLQTAVTTSSYYLGFNMLDKVLGGYTEKAKKLRQAISIVVDYEEYISIFQNGRGVPAQSIIPPGIFGHVAGDKGINQAVYTVQNGVQRRSVEEAKALLAEAGYANGIDSSTAKPLVLYFDTMDSGPDSKARLNWLRKQFNKLNIQLVIRGTDYNRFQEKMRNGNAQMFMWGWNADYPDPENFLFLLYGKNAKAVHGGENAANYQNELFDALFETMSTMDNTPQREAIINQMIAITQDDAPWLWGFHPKAFSLHHAWYKNVNPNLMANNKTKYINIDPAQRHEYQAAWNKPVYWPLVVLLLVFICLLMPAYVIYRRIERSTAL